MTVLVTLVTAGVVAQSVSTVRIPSEDELRMALDLGEIGYTQYVVLYDLLRTGITPDTRYLIDEFPNLFHVDSSATSQTTPLETDQLNEIPKTRSPSRLRYAQRFSTRFEESPTRWWRTKVSVDVSEQLSASMQFERSLGGKERFVDRDVTYRAQQGFVRKAELGNFTVRPGLGVALGYTGKRVGSDSALSLESFAYPDHGGLNGLHLVTQSGNVRTGLLGSQVRDNENGLSVVGVYSELVSGKFRPGVAVVHTSLAGRAVPYDLSATTLSTYGRYLYGEGHVAVDIAAQRYNSQYLLAGTAEGRHRFNLSEFRYAFWGYDKGLFDVMTGSKSAVISRTRVLNVPDDYSYRSRRSGQAGGLLRGIVPLESRLQMSGTILYGAYSPSHYLGQTELELNWTVREDFQLRARYLDERRAAPGSSSGDNHKQRWQIETDLPRARWRVTSYIGGTADDRGDYLTWFARLRLNPESKLTVEVWSNAARITKSGLEYWYGFLKLVQELSVNVEFTVKLMHRYNHNSTTEHQSTLMCELVGAW